MRIETYGVGGYDPTKPNYNIVNIEEVDNPVEDVIVHNVIETKTNHTEHHTLETVHRTPLKYTVATVTAIGLVVLDLVANVLH